MRGFFSEIWKFIRRNGIKNVLFHVIEVYVGAFLRVLPGIEGLFLRSLFYRLIFRSCGPSLFIYPHVYIIFSHKISAGERLSINTNTYIDGRAGIEIGNNVMIGPNCSLVTAGHGFERVDIPMSYQPVKYDPIFLGNDIWIGANAVIRGGVKIHDGSIIAAGTVVVSDVPPYCIFGGVPGKVIRYRKSEDSKEKAT